MTKTLKDLIADEATFYKRLNQCVSDPFITHAALKKASSDYENAVEDCFEHSAGDFKSFELKCDFIFKFIERNYEDHKQLRRIQHVLIKDIQVLKNKA